MCLFFFNKIFNKKTKQNTIQRAARTRKRIQTRACIATKWQLQGRSSSSPLGSKPGMGKRAKPKNWAFFWQSLPSHTYVMLMLLIFIKKGMYRRNEKYYIKRARAYKRVKRGFFVDPQPCAASAWFVACQPANSRLRFANRLYGISRIARWNFVKCSLRF